MKWWKEKGYRSLSSWEAKERETKNRMETDDEEGFGLNGEATAMAQNRSLYRAAVRDATL